MERQSQTRINLKEWTIISWVIWGGEKPGRPPAELNQGPPTLSLRQDKKERTSHRTAAPAWASSTLSPVRARNLQILRYFLAQPPPFRCQTRLAAVISAEAPRPSRTELVGMGETRVRMCATPPPPFYEHLYTRRVNGFSTMSDQQR